jgi:peptidoglycan hydrolase-like protein with peptidoglycan-binding domain
VRLVASLALTVIAALVAPVAGAHAATDPMPGDFTGYAFDACEAPPQRKMDAWRRHSPYAGVGIYIAGENRACPEQEHLTPSWVETQAAKGWRLFPLVVGRQASCSLEGRYRGGLIAADPTDDYARAQQQGRRAARDGADAAKGLGIGERSVLWYDLEDFDVSQTHCRRSALAFVSGWTEELHERGYRSGLYSSAASGINALDTARRLSPGSYTLPDHLWIAEWDGRSDLRSEYVADDGWWPKRRVKQYRGDHFERHGGVRMEVDSNVADLGRGTTADPSNPTCRTDLDFVRYHRLRQGDRGPQVRAGQCLLRERDLYEGKVDGRFRRSTADAVRSFQRHQGLPRTARLDRSTWTALLAAGETPLLKFGSGGDAVRRLQRALNAAGVADLAIDGVFAAPEQGAVQHYQKGRGLPATGVVTSRVWAKLQAGRA